MDGSYPKLSRMLLSKVSRTSSQRNAPLRSSSTRVIICTFRFVAFPYYVSRLSDSLFPNSDSSFRSSILSPLSQDRQLYIRRAVSPTHGVRTRPIASHQRLLNDAVCVILCSNLHFVLVNFLLLPGHVSPLRLGFIILPQLSHGSGCDEQSVHRHPRWAVLLEALTGGVRMRLRGQWC